MTSLSVRPWEIPLRLGPGTSQAFPVTLSLSTMVSLSVIHVDGESVLLKYIGLKLNVLLVTHFSEIFMFWLNLNKTGSKVAQFSLK